MDIEPLTQIKTLDQFEKIFTSWNEKYNEDIKHQLSQYHESMIQFKENQRKIVSEIGGGKQMLSTFKLKLTSLLKPYRNGSTTSNGGSSTDDVFNDEISNKINNLKESMKKTTELHESIQLILPKYPSWFLRQCIGDVNITLYWKKFNYKERYESFKFNSSVVFLILWLINWIFIRNRLFDSVMIGYAIWYYSSLTIQEGILVANGSHIKCWWRAHHFLCVLAAGLMLLWPPNATYDSIRNVHYIFGVFQGIIQMIQYRYQKAQLYRINSLGSGENMEITNEGITKQLLIGLSLMSIFLVLNYCTQFYFAYRIYQIYRVQGGWQLFMLVCLYNIFGIGNLFTLLSVVISKFTHKAAYTRPKEDLRKTLNLSLSDYDKLTKMSL